jgi:hypothetical protein
MSIAMIAAVVVVLVAVLRAASMGHPVGQTWNRAR